MHLRNSRSDIQMLLEEWSRWRRLGHGANIGYPSQSAFVRVSKMGGWATKIPLITDEQAGRVDLAVSRLKLKCIKGDLRWEVLTDRYLGGKSDSVIARRLRVDRRTVATARKAAESWVESYIDSEVFHTHNAY